MDGIVHGLIDVARERGRLALTFFECRERLFVLRHVDKILLVDRVQARADDAVAGVGLHPQIQQHAEKRRGHDEKHPGELIARILAVIEHEDQHDKDEERLAADKILGHKLAEIDPDRERDERLDDQEQDHKAGAAEDDRKRAALPAAGKTETVFVDFYSFLLHPLPLLSRSSVGVRSIHTIPEKTG